MCVCVYIKAQQGSNSPEGRVSRPVYYLNLIDLFMYIKHGGVMDQSANGPNGRTSTVRV